MIQIFDMEQGSSEWFAARAGIPTASEFGTILAKGKDGKSPSLTRRTYMLKLAGEILTGEPSEGFANAHTERGKLLEPEARDLYALINDVEPQRVGFIRNGDRGCSPDSLIGDAGGLEIKTGLPHIVLAALIKDEFPPEHKAQIQGNLWLAEREWWDCVLYCPKLPPLIKRAYRDDAYIKGLSTAVDCFNDELAATVAWVRRYGQPERAAA